MQNIKELKDRIRYDKSKDFEDIDFKVHSVAIEHVNNGAIVLRYSIRAKGMIHVSYILSNERQAK